MRFVLPKKRKPYTFSGSGSIQLLSRMADSAAIVCTEADDAVDFLKAQSGPGRVKKGDSSAGDKLLPRPASW
jgi:hypothetical protein